MTENKIYNYEDEIVGVDEVAGTDIKINPDYYIHHALLKAQVALTKENLTEGLIQFRIMVEHLEGLCKAAKLLDKEKYALAIKEFIESDDYKKEEDQKLKSARLANKKIELIMVEAFENRVRTEPMKA